MLTPEEITKYIERDKSSKEKRFAEIGERYYEARHDILDYRIFYVDANGKLREDKTRSNIRVPHPFFTELVDQKAQYLLSGDGPIIRAVDEKQELQKALDAYFGGDFVAELSDLITGAAMHGWGYLYAYKGENDRTRFMFADALHTVEIGAKEAPDGMPRLIYYYVERVGMDERVARVQVWDEKEVAYYVSRKKDGSVSALELDASVNPNPRQHILYQDGEKRFQDTYGVIPFFRLDNRKNRKNDLVGIKALIDDYDLMACGLSNNIQDVVEGIYVVKGFDGQDLDEMITNIRAKKTIGVDGEHGGVDIKTIDIPYEARKVKLELDEENIYRFGMGFNSAQVGDGNITNIVIKSRYALLDLKCTKIEKRLRAVLDKIVGLVLEEINRADGTGYTMDDVEYVFERRIITNDLDMATIKKTEAETTMSEVSALMGAVSVLGQDIVAEELCKRLGLDYEAVQDRLPADPYDLNAASETLKGAVEVDEP